ncbi:MAG: class I SAM-dependent methyltransferase [Methanomassiliicoccales archaeon]|nr:MAG: class I SAM-dependent methyltransferase [Methanomassiliicoccales archaeon]
MDMFELYNISEHYMELINPFDSEKIITLGKFLELKNGSKIIEFGSGFGEVLILWAKEFGIKGVGIDIREYACQRAEKKIKDQGLEETIEIVCGNGAEYKFEKQGFDVAACIGASFIWGDYRSTIKAMKEAIKPDGKLIIGEPYWIKEPVPASYKEENKVVLREIELLTIAREEGFEFEYMMRANQDDWDRYEASNWYSLNRWLEENPDHPEKQEVVEWLHKLQEDYLKFGREYLGWAVYILNPIKY